MSPMEISAAVGTTFANRYAKYGATAPGFVKDANRLYTVLIGRPKSGKSTFAASNSKALRIDLDRAGPTPGELCVRVPDTGADGVSKVITWEWLEELKTQLVLDAKRGEPRPQTIIIDTLTTLVERARERVLRHGQKVGDKPIEVWNDLHGKQAWGMTYDLIRGFLGDLAQHYGLVLCVHFLEQSKALGENAFKVEEDIVVPPKLWPGIAKDADMLMWLNRKDTRTPPEKNAKDPKAAAGLTIESSYNLVFKTKAGLSLSKILGSRIAMPDEITGLPLVGGWEVFRSTYNDAAAKMFASANSSQ